MSNKVYSCFVLITVLFTRKKALPRLARPLLTLIGSRRIHCVLKIKECKFGKRSTYIMRGKIALRLRHKTSQVYTKPYLFTKYIHLVADYFKTAKQHKIYDHRPYYYDSR